jgi:hypothetical protein
LWNIQRFRYYRNCRRPCSRNPVFLQGLCPERFRVYRLDAGGVGFIAVEIYYGY